MAAATPAAVPPVAAAPAAASPATPAAVPPAAAPLAAAAPSAAMPSPAAPRLVMRQTGDGLPPPAAAPSIGMPEVERLSSPLPSSYMPSYSAIPPPSGLPSYADATPPPCTATVAPTTALTNDIEQLLATEPDAEPLPVCVGNMFAEDGMLSHLQNSLSLAGRAVMLSVQNHTAGLLTLRECRLAQGEWRLPPPSGVPSQAQSCFGAITQAGDVRGQATYVDKHRHQYVLTFTQPATGIGTATATCTQARVSADESVNKPLTVTTVKGRTAQGLREISFRLSE